MSDERMRELARRARKTDDPVAELRSWVEARRSGALPEAAFALVDRLSGGELDRERLALAAYAAHPGALALLMEETAYYAALAGDLAAVHVVFGDEPLSSLDFQAWVLGLERWGQVPLRVVQIALGRMLVERARGGGPPRTAALRDRFVALSTTALDEAYRQVIGGGGAQSHAPVQDELDELCENERQTSDLCEAVLRALDPESWGTFNRYRRLPQVVCDAEYTGVPSNDLALAARRAVATWALR